MTRRVLVTRNPNRAGELVRRLRDLGFEPVLSPLAEPEAVTGEAEREARAALAAGPYDVLTLTSVNGVRGLQRLLEGAVPAEAVWCVGEATTTAAREAGLDPRDPPPTNSARGMLAAWSEVMGTERPLRILCVHGLPARPELAEGLRQRGHRVREAVVYRSVAYPASEPLVPWEASEPDGAALSVLDRDQTAHQLRASNGEGFAAVVATSPRLVRTLTELGPVRAPVVCIGDSTEDEARRLGLNTVLSAGTSPVDLADGVERAVRSGR